MKASIINLLLRSNTECLLLVKENADKEVLHEERYTVKNFNELIRLFVFNYAKYVETTKININQYKSINKYSQQNMIKNIKKIRSIIRLTKNKKVSQYKFLLSKY